jgi:SAM-dependent methyltransferase
MFAYTGFAQVYDTFMDNVPYDMWTEYLHSLLKEYGINDGLVLELGCGTGNVTRRLSKIGYDMIGIDFSEEMLEIAREKEYLTDYAYEEQEEDNEENIGKDNEENIEEDYNTSPILYLNQDMREFELFGTVAAVVCICDGMNYITKEEDLLKVFKLANNYLDKEGVFIFDLNTEYKYKNLLADNVIAENREDCSFIWENYYDNEKKTNEYNMTIFVKQDEEDNEEEAFVRFRETHVQKAYSLDTIKNLIKESGMEFVAAYDAFTRMPPNDKSERLYVIAKEKHQDDKTYII